MEDIKLLEYLVEDFKRSGIKFNLELVRLGGVVEIEYNLMDCQPFLVQNLFGYTFLVLDRCHIP